MNKTDAPRRKEIGIAPASGTNTSVGQKIQSSKASSVNKNKEDNQIITHNNANNV